MVETPPNSSPSFLKKLPNKITELLSLPLIYSTLLYSTPHHFLNFQTSHYFSKAIELPGQNNDWSYTTKLS